MELEFFVIHDIKDCLKDVGEALMAKLLALYLFTWKEWKQRVILHRRQMLVLRHLLDEGLMQQLEEQWTLGRNDYPIRPVWNSVFAGIVDQHQAIETCKGRDQYVHAMKSDL